MSKVVVEVLLDQNLDRPLDYLAPAGIQVGARVEVPLKSTTKKGTVAKIKQKSEFTSVKEITRIIGQELSEKEWKLAHFMAHYYAAPLQRVLKCFVPINVRNETKEQTKLFLRPAKTHDACIAHIAAVRGKKPKHAEALEAIIKTPKGVFFSTLTCTRQIVDTLEKQGWIIVEKRVELGEEEYFPSPPKKLNEEQEECLSSIVSSMGKFSTHLIFGVTGSGKTEVYMQAIQKALDTGKSAIMLVPEISLTSQTIERFKARFQQKIAVLHHRRSLGERSTAWEDLKKGDAKLVIGARSALFAPVQNLGLIIVDEEHDSSYKQSEEIPCYHARDTAVMRGRFEECTVILGSATPSIESRYNAEIGKYVYHALTKRATNATLPSIRIVDMERYKSYFSDELLSGIRKRLEKGEQALLLLNKRGYHRMQTCQKCRETVKCPACDLNLTYHREENKLRCHLCDFAQEIPRQCPKCGSSETLQFKGFGTEHVERSLHAIFPEIRTIRMDRDTTSKKHSHEELFKQFRAHKADVLIGTQMIAKGFHFPSVTLVGVLNADSALHIPDFRAPEHLFQLITQVAGRAGRAELPGEVILQTYMPEHQIILEASSQDYEAFYKREIEERKTYLFPPFTRLVKFLITDPNPEIARQKAEELRASFPKEWHLLPVAPAGHAKINNLSRFQFILKTPNINTIMTSLPKSSKHVKIDADPISIYF